MKFLRGIRLFPAVYLGLLALALITGAVARFRLPQQPFLDADVWGYLNPAFSKLTGGSFQHTFGRDTLYPGFVYVLLKVFGDFRAISVAQHLLGLGTGLLMAAAFGRFCVLLRSGAAGALRLVGLAPAAAYLHSPYALFYEHSVRPEAVFPFFAILSIALNLEFIFRRWVRPRPGQAAWLGAAGLIVSVVLYKLKPSFGIGSLFVNVPLAISLLQRGMPWPLKAAMVGGAVAFAAVFLVLPERALERNDPTGFMFLPDTLFTIHADLIRDQIAEDLKSGHPLPYPRELLTRMHDRLGELIAASSAPGHHVYKSLGFDPDYLLYTDCVFNTIFPATPAGYRRRADFGSYYYRRTALHHPARMFRKVLIQLATFYHFERSGSFVTSKHTVAPEKPLPVGPLYERNIEIFDSHPQLGMYPPAQALVDGSRLLTKSPAEMSEPSPLAFIQAVIGYLYVPGLLAALTACAWAFSSAARRIEWGMTALVVLLIYSYNFGNNLTIAIVHSLDVGRYILNELAFTLLASTVGLVFVGAVLARTLPELVAPAAGARRSRGSLPLLPRLVPGDGSPAVCVLLLGDAAEGDVPPAAHDSGALAGAEVRREARLPPDTALLDAFAESTSDVLIIVSGAGIDIPACAGALLDAYREHPVDMILAARDETPTGDARVLKAVLDCELSDPAAAARLVSRRFYRNAPVGRCGAGWQTELTARAAACGFRVREVRAGVAAGCRKAAKTAWYTEGLRLGRLAWALLRDYRPVVASGALAAAFFVLALIAGWEPLRAAYTGRKASHAVPAVIASCALGLAILAVPVGLLLDAALRRSRDAFQIRIRDGAWGAPTTRRGETP